MPDYRNSTVRAFETGLAFRKHNVDVAYLLYGDKNTFLSSLQLLTELPSY